MVKADQQGAFYLQFFDKFLLIPSTLSVIGNCATSYIYNKWKFGEIDKQNLYRAHRLMYACLNV